MKTVQFTGTEKQFTNLMGVSNTKLNLPIMTETRFYVVEVDDERYEPTMDDEQFMELAEENGRVYSPNGFQEAFNFEEVSTAIDVIRIINVNI